MNINMGNAMKMTIAMEKPMDEEHEMMFSEFDLMKHMELKGNVGG